MYIPVILTTLVFLSSGNKLNLIQSFFEYNSLKFGTIINCNNQDSVLMLAKFLMRNNIFINVLNENHTIKTELLNKTNYYFGIVLNGSCPNVYQVLFDSSKAKLFAEKYHWLIYDFNNNTVSMLRNVSIFIDAEIYLASFVDEEKWNIFEAYNPSASHGGSLVINYVGTSENNILDINYRGAKYWNRRNLTGITFKSIIVLSRPFSGRIEDYVYDDSKRDVNTWNRFNYVITKHVQELYNFSMKVSVSNSWGYILPNGSFDGLVGALQRKEIDFGTSPVFYKVERAKYVDYSRVTWVLKTSFIFRHPKTYTSLYSIYLRPLADSVWICTSLALILLIMVLKTISVYEWRFRRELGSICDRTWGFAFISVLGILCQQGASGSSLYSGRIIIFFSLLLSIFLYQFYSASIVATLLMDAPVTIKSIRDLLFSSLQIGVEDVIYNVAYFNETTDPTTLKLQQKKLIKAKHLGNSTTGYYKPEEGMQYVKAGGFAFLVENPTAYKEIEDKFSNAAICELAEVEVFHGRPLMSVLQKHSPFREMFNYGLHRLAEHGIIRRQRLHWSHRKPECIEKSARDSIDIIEFSPILELLSLGLFLSCAVLCLEIIIYNWLHRKDNNLARASLFPYVN